VAGFELIISGRFWVIAKANKKPDDQTNFDSPYLFNTTIHALP